MNKVLKITLISLLIIIVVLGLTGFGTWRYLDATFVNIESDYPEKTQFEELTVDGYAFLDRNGNGSLDVYEDDRRTTNERVEDVLSQMSIEEKIHLLKGSGLASAMGSSDSETAIPGAVGTIVPTPRLGLPTVYLSDGPAGLRIQPTREGAGRTYYCTAFPIATQLASTWNEELVEEIGVAMGNEALEYGIDVILGPGANLHRHPLTGRNFEYYSEDPLLTGFMGAAMVNGIESNGVGTSVKHFVANNQETNRMLNDVIISERALREMYLRGFEIIVEKSQPWTIMSSYNMVNGTAVSENRFLLTEVLRGDWGFEGLVMTDWFGGYYAPAQITAGNDLLEPGTNKQWKELTEAFSQGELSEEDIDTSVRRILTLVIESKKMDAYKYGDNPDLEANAKLARQAAAEGIVLLKNEDQTLPMAQGQNVALFGVTSYNFIAGGTGSGDVNEAYTVSLEEGLTNAGFSINEKARAIYIQHKEANKEAFVQPEGLDALFNPFTPPEMNYSKSDITAVAAEADIAIVTIGRNAGEGGDRVLEGDFLLTEGEVEMLNFVKVEFSAQGKKTIVVMNTGGVIETATWKENPDAILLAWQGGQEGGNSVADVLSGNVNPSGKLTMTFPIKVEDHAADANFPEGGGEFSLTGILSNMLSKPEPKPESEKIKDVDYTNYDEGIFVGYRHFDKAGLEVSYPFGYGLSYTSFEYSVPAVTIQNDSIMIEFLVENVGEVAGKEVVQIYSAKVDTEIERAPQALITFGKTEVIPVGESQKISFKVPVTELSYWDESIDGWNIEAGEYDILISSSSRDVRLKERIVVSDR